MIGKFNVVLITRGQKTSSDGKVYFNITVMQDDVVLKMSCTEDVFNKCGDLQFKPICIDVALKEYANDKSYSCVGVYLNK